MNRIFRFGLTVALLMAFIVGCAQQKEAAVTEKDEPKDVKRIGMVIGIKPDRINEYKEVHADSHPGVRDLLSKYHMENFSIFMHKLDNDKYYLFGYYEYTGENYEKDMAELAKEPRNNEWLQMTDPMQIPLPGEDSWSIMEQVYFNP